MICIFFSLACNATFQPFCLVQLFQAALLLAPSSSSFLHVSKPAKCQKFHHFIAVVCYRMVGFFRYVNNISISELGYFITYLYVPTSIDYIVYLLVILMFMRLI